MKLQGIAMCFLMGTLGGWAVSSLFKTQDKKDYTIHIILQQEKEQDKNNNEAKYREI